MHYPYSYYYGPGSLYWRLHHGNPHLDRVRESEEGSTRENPDPVPWAVAFLVSKVSSKEAIANMTDQAVAQQLLAAADRAITEFIDGDDICPPWPFPGPPPWLSAIASELTLVANTLQAGTLRAGILQTAGQVLDRAQVLATGAVVAAVARSAAASA